MLNNQFFLSSFTLRSVVALEHLISHSVYAECWILLLKFTEIIRCVWMRLSSWVCDHMGDFNYLSFKKMFLKKKPHTQTMQESHNISWMRVRKKIAYKIFREHTGDLLHFAVFRYVNKPASSENWRDEAKIPKTTDTSIVCLGFLVMFTLNTHAFVRIVMKWKKRRREEESKNSQNVCNVEK